MPKTRNILIGVCGIGAVTLIGLIVVVVYISNEIRAAENELDIEMETFKLKASDLWKNMMSMNITHRQRRQLSSSDESPDVTGSLSKESPDVTAGPQEQSKRSDSYEKESSENVKGKNNCPPGPPGPPGPNGMDGYDGMDGM
ncbi:unnamed protein product, partial [Onchocerca flexuosa]|uniref:Col_cuticle_N domain-containing protein n=1 Tax=Onchocerca flexuosa TaxID=387005 RepID=A0A183HLU8_9BILA